MHAQFHEESAYKLRDMMTDFRKLSETMLASPQIMQDDLAQAADQGVTLIINNRPDGESVEDPQGPEIEAAARSLGIAYLSIPISQAGFSMPQVDAMAQALKTAEKEGGKVLAYCRSGTRSTLLWAIARAKLGDAPDAIAIAAQGAGYNVAPVRPTIDMLASNKGA